MARIFPHEPKTSAAAAPSLPEQNVAPASGEASVSQSANVGQLRRELLRRIVQNEARRQSQTVSSPTK